MLKLLQISSNYFDHLLHQKNIYKVEQLLLKIAIFSFLAHLLIIFLGNNFVAFSHFQHSYLKAIYTPFSFILFYEVFLLVIIIPSSISEFIGKQFEVITLITLRSFFHDIPDFDIKSPINLQNTAFLSLMYDLSASLIMLSLTILYYKIFQKDLRNEKVKELNTFISIKKMVSLCMIFVLLILSVSSFYSWIIDMINALKINNNYPNPNTIFYEDFFSIMIFVDVLLLIVSFIYHSSFFIIFRNASFIITTILLRMSLTIEKPMNYLVVLIGFLFSIISFYLYKFRKINNSKE